MAVIELDSLPRTGVLLGIDPGAKAMGVAATDALRMIASPVEVVHRGKTLAPSLARLFEIYDERGAVALVIGLPLNMDGTEGRRAQSARALAYNILLKRDVPILFQDERLSSAEAENAMLEAAISRKRLAERIDAQAAAIILKSTLALLDRAG
ncbi:Holliday junction resolvase RuvX [Hyphomonas johnsonii]|uniref:Putative pre-16S rRNA nuclease n=1 Tax=Hyphomonas johnsonii MHS-2 TaxID=1280950 RepID=A0A059FU93_9PROT|nr:Holliday junction resolvase RuvX [Hyphomonas johnsonii]KCZ94013.1 Holliday junction resolvase YqgF [Hyphomonas johnsonii MHS-2]